MKFWKGTVDSSTWYYDKVNFYDTLHYKNDWTDWDLTALSAQ